MTAARWLALLVLVVGSCSVEKFEFAESPAQTPTGDTPSMISDADASPPTNCSNAGVCLQANPVISADGNGDGRISPGESATIEVQMRNGLSSTVSGLYAQLTSVPDAARVTTCSGPGNVCPGECACTATQALGSLQPQQIYRALRFALQTDRATVPNSLTFGVRMSDSIGRVWDDSFQLSVMESEANIEFGEAVITRDDNDDKLLSPGDQVTLALFAANRGRAAAAGVHASLTSIPAGVLVTACTGVSGEQCPAGCACPVTAGRAIPVSNKGDYPVLTLTADVSKDLPLATPLSFGISFKDETGRVWQDDFQLMLAASDGRISSPSRTITQDTDNDKRFEAGETATVGIYAVNMGLSTVRNLVARLENVPASLTIKSCTGTAGTCANACDCQLGAGLRLTTGQSSANPVLSFQATLAASAPTPVLVKVVFEDDAHHTWSQDVRLD